MLETEIKKLTKALEDNTAALLGQSAGATPRTVAEAAGNTAASPAAPGPLDSAPAPTAMPNMPGMPIGVPNTAAALQQQPPAQAAPQPMTHQVAQAELTAIVQQLGDPAQVQAVMAKYGSNQLNQIPADSLFAMVQECKGLLAA